MKPLCPELLILFSHQAKAAAEEKFDGLWETAVFMW